jgi:hypothetical protein
MAAASTNQKRVRIVFLCHLLLGTIVTLSAHIATSETLKLCDVRDPLSGVSRPLSPLGLAPDHVPTMPHTFPLGPDPHAPQATPNNTQVIYILLF